MIINYLYITFAYSMRRNTTSRPLKCLLHTLMVRMLGSSLSPLVHIYVHIAEVWWLYDVEHIIIHDLFINTRLAEESILKRFILHYCSVVTGDVGLNIQKTPHFLILWDGVRSAKNVCFHKPNAKPWVSNGCLFSEIICILFSALNSIHFCITAFTRVTALVDMTIK